MLVQLTPLALLAALVACQAYPAGEASEPDHQVAAAATGIPGAGALAFGSPESRVTQVLGPVKKTWQKEGFDWRAYQRGDVAIEAGFYRDKLGHVVIRPRLPFSWTDAEAWIRAMVPTYDPAKLVKPFPETWGYFANIEVGHVPFEVGLQIHREGDRVTALYGEMNWLD